MNTWQEFQAIHPLLLRIEERYTRLLNFESKFEDPPTGFEFSEEDLDAVRSAVYDSIRYDAQELTDKMYYWLYPFYDGNFLRLVAALGACGIMHKQQDNQASRMAFYKFFRSVPLEERLKLGEKLNQPDLAEQAARIEAKLTKRKSMLKAYMEKYHSN